MKRCFIFCLFFIACTTHKPNEDAKLDISIRGEQSDKIDIGENVYTVFFMSKPPLRIKFDLSKEEMGKIKTLYFSLKLYNLPENLEIDDKCHVMPETYTYIDVKSGSFQQQIKINAGCKNFYFPDRGKAKRIITFSHFIRDIVESKQEVKDAPKSDIRYL